MRSDCSPRNDPAQQRRIICDELAERGAARAGRERGRRVGAARERRAHRPALDRGRAGRRA
jgi:hypothetical protein